MRPVAEAGPRSPTRLVLLGGLVLLVIAGLLALGTWQVARRSWKLDLIARVDARVHATPVVAPGPAAWSGVAPATDEYRRVTASGTFLNDRETLVQAVTELGAGDWVLTPLRTTDGFTVLINRGFVPSDRRDPANRAAGQPAGPVQVTGLLRLTEPKGGFLRSNDPAGNRWYSRDVAAIATARAVADAAPYFIDADATANPGGLPLGGLTVIAFPNNHLVYAITWYGLALMLAAATAYLGQEEWSRRRAGEAG
ncbi:SURF1 family protein [Acidisphaera sp. L21]|uniref:SURF1 family protein n=1 Tax=Acidisphaera sp. L21 TaxID=1641851 RepID=UPI0020B127C5|nr:SURF1 family protein [Acidisphaera sp. L21]